MPPQIHERTYVERGEICNLPAFFFSLFFASLFFILIDCSVRVVFVLFP